MTDAEYIAELENTLRSVVVAPSEMTYEDCNCCNGWICEHCGEQGDTAADIEHTAECPYQRAVAVLAMRGNK